jgi:maleate isomerase
MPDVLGWRRKFGVLAPSTNTVVEPDFDELRPAGVTNHLSRIFTPNVKGLSNETFRAGIATISDSVMDAIKSVMTCEPDHLVMGMSGLTFLGGLKGADAFVRQVEEVAGVSISVGSHAAAAALRAFGGVSRLAILSPYWPVMNEEVKRYFTEAGFQVVRDHAMQVTSWAGIAAVTPAACRDALRRLDGDDVDAIVQVGTNLSMLRVAAAAELWLGKPVIAINAATYWQALRSNDIREPIAGFGRLLEEF